MVSKLVAEGLGINTYDQHPLSKLPVPTYLSLSRFLLVNFFIFSPDQ